VFWLRFDVVVVVVVVSALDTHDERVFWFCSDDHEIKSIGVGDDYSKNSIQRVISNGGWAQINTLCIYLLKLLFVIYKKIKCRSSSHPSCPPFLVSPSRLFFYLLTPPPPLSYSLINYR